MIPLYNQSEWTLSPLNILNEIDEHLLNQSGNDLYKLLTVKNIPHCEKSISDFNNERWPTLLQRVR